jgi:hypothetical protein
MKLQAPILPGVSTAGIETTMLYGAAKIFAPKKIPDVEHELLPVKKIEPEVLGYFGGEVRQIPDIKTEFIIKPMQETRVKPIQAQIQVQPQMQEQIVVPITAFKPVKVVKPVEAVTTAPVTPMIRMPIIIPPLPKTYGGGGVFAWGDEFWGKKYKFRAFKLPKTIKLPKIKW